MKGWLSRRPHTARPDVVRLHLPAVMDSHGCSSAGGSSSRFPAQWADSHNSLHSCAVTHRLDPFPVPFLCAVVAQEVL